MGDELPKDAAAKRAILYSESTGEAELNALADRFISVERFGEALEVLERTLDTDRLGKILREGVDRGSSFLVLRVENMTGEPVPESEWRETADRAREAGKYHDAYRALLKAGDEDGAEALRAEHMPDYEPFKPEGK